MLGREYESYEDFKRACRLDRGSLYAPYVLGKVYTADQLRTIAVSASLELDELAAQADLEQRGGIGRRYNIATLISGALEPQELGEVLARLDHQLYFPVITYFCFPSSPNYESLETLVTYLRRDHEHLRDVDFAMEFNGLVEPPGRACRLESTSVDWEANVLSLLFSTTRILVIPDGQYGSLEYYFLARIPALVQILFNHRLIEISMPTFAEAPGASSNGSHRVPDRYQKTTRNAVGESLQYLPDSPSAFKFRRFTLYLEQELGAEDMGWKIEPGHEAAFDLQGLVPLKEVLDTFAESLHTECEKRGLTSHPLSEIDLYAVFRAVKEQSYTDRFVLRASLGARGGEYAVSTLYGQENSGHAPVLWVPRNRRAVAQSLREAAAQSQTADITNPYDLDELLS